jgi:hypothetical protein
MRWPPPWTWAVFPSVVSAVCRWSGIGQGLAAAARLQIIAVGAGPEIREAAGKMRAAMYDLARARAKVAPGAVPREPIRVARGAEDDFARAAQADLERLGRFDKS